ncbi:3-oxoacyl-[acyl-carrier protein] reductase [Pilibacter termitis]|uniref:3-oxoacyl-[acyl-carrier protein] reductase n=1 Tax=Pilibacter termitis TaxID=263852 RepID=A0A1T4PZA5_9ENTE|nr:3-oxoacyl-ACP reductase [Pilibacter termitis]SJZ96815.1 3-oxoacyl-[acyl-carrier protein] reductase [Pilibacter termitis]
MKFLEKHILITGCASGIGLAQTRAFLSEGAKVYGVDRSEMKENLGEQFHFFQGDASDERFVNELSEKIEKLDILCNTAGVLDDYLPLEKTSFSLWQTILHNNLDSMFLITKVFLPKILQAQGAILNMSSIAGMVAGGGGISYTTSKHAVSGFSKQLALDMAPENVHVLAIAPGAIETPMNRKDFEENGGEMARSVAEETPMKRWAKPEEVARLTLFLASEDAKYMTGSVVTFDGGWTTK